MSKDETPFSDQLKKAVDEMQIEAKVRDATAAAEQAVLRGLEATGSYVRDHRADIEGFLERAGAAIDRQTGGRYADRVGQLRGQLSAGVASLADRAPNGEHAASGELEAPEPPELPGTAEAPDAPERRAGSDDGNGNGWAGSTDPV